MSKSRQSNRAADALPGGTVAVRSLALRLPPGHRLAAHSHGWAQVVYAARGVMSVEAGAKQWVVPPLRCLWMPAGVSHGIETIGETWMRTLYIRPDRADEIAPGVRVLDVSPLLRELILEVVRRGALDEARDAERDLASVVIAQVAASRELGLALPLPTDPRARGVAERVRREPGDISPLSELVRGMGAAPRTAERLFVKETGLSFGRWRQQARLQFAVRRLAEGLDVTTVALECGYDSVSAFVTMFRRALGTTPGKYVENAVER